jgi:hypothetical protein
MGVFRKMGERKPALRPSGRRGVMVVVRNAALGARFDRLSVNG